MIKFDSEKETVAINGTVNDLVIDAVSMVHVIYKSLKKYNGGIPAEHFKGLINECMPDAFLDEEDIKKKTEESHKRAGKMLEEMQEMIDKLKEIHDCIGVDDTKKENFQDEFHKWLYSQESEEE